MMVKMATKMLLGNNFSSITNFEEDENSILTYDIYTDNPHDQTSRWSSDSSEFPQYLILKLSQPSIVKTITFGKYEKAHVCNLKKFCVYGGLTEDNMVLLLESGLKNNSIPEVFNLRHTIGCNKFPVRYIKIMPLQTWGSTFNFSIWHVSLKGCGDWNVVHKCINAYSEYREKEAIRLCLKHLREFNYSEAFDSLLKHSKVQLEDPFLTEIHDELVKKGNHERCEELVQKAYEEGYFQQYITQLDYKPKWNPIIVSTDSTFKETPGMRGGHQMCIDVNHQIIYLFGGWDGTQDLSDLWSFNISTEEWTCISRDTSQEGGPCGRSCHKMCLDSKRRQIFTLGRFVDPSMRNEENMKSDFYLYEIESNSWTSISDDTSSVGGPSLIFDHQIVMDEDNRVIYVFGGRVVTPNEDASTARSREHKYSGLFSYHVSTNTWKQLMEDGPSFSCSKIRARIGHSMLFHSGTRELFILGGQRHKEFLTDFFTYSVDTNTICFISDGTKKESGSLPSPGFTQKATIDTNLNEIHILAGLSKEKNRKVENVRNSFWIYNISQNKWSCVYHNEVSTEEHDGSLFIWRQPWYSCRPKP
ncbi:Muskelin [Armadillidium vulgare]|nr:Muskelin [Armadillidium vulgare]